MLPNHLCRRDIPGLSEAIPISDYAEITQIDENKIQADIVARRLMGVFYRGGWYVEAPPFCEDKLARLFHKRKIDQNKKEQARNQNQQDSAGRNPPPTNSKPHNEEIVHAQVLGLRGRVTPVDIKRHYRERMMEYHPDKVAALGIKLRELAEIETKKINAAYEFFRKKYRMEN